MPHRFMSALIACALSCAVLFLTACSPESDAPRPAATTAAAPVLEHEDVRAFAIGELTGMALRDGTIDVPNDARTFGLGRTVDEVSARLAAAGLSTHELHLSIQPLLVKTADRVLLFDTGAGGNMGDSGGRLAASMAAAGVDADSITDVFLSHAHGDHVGGLLSADGTLAFPRAAIHIASPEWAFLRQMSAEAAAGAAIPRHAAFIAAIAPRIAEFAPGADIIPGVVRAVEIRGHTPGHSGYLITSGQDSLLYVGDAMHHFIVSVQKPEWANEFDTDAATAASSRSELLARSAASGQRLYAVHFPFPGLGRVERRADGFVWAAE